jgi:DMSO/TMAO reductase YedYZ heme-binding membrane subunit
VILLVVLLLVALLALASFKQSSSRQGKQHVRLDDWLAVSLIIAAVSMICSQKVTTIPEKALAYSSSTDYAVNLAQEIQ